MRVIDLLNKIANGEEVPKKIEYNEHIYCYDKDWKDYKDTQVVYNSYLFSCKYHTTDFLNYEVQIIEDILEDKKIKHIGKIYDMSNFDKKYPGVVELLKDIINKQYEIIDKMNGDSNERNK